MTITITSLHTDGTTRTAAFAVPHRKHLVAALKYLGSSLRSWEPTVCAVRLADSYETQNLNPRQFYWVGNATPQQYAVHVAHGNW